MADGLLAGKVILVTGGADGIGRECALAYAREGAHVAIADINADKTRQTAADLAQEGLAIACDVGDPGSVEQAVEASIERFARLDAYVSGRASNRIRAPSKIISIAFMRWAIARRRMLSRMPPFSCFPTRPGSSLGAFCRSAVGRNSVTGGERAAS